jgi:hypothetical protein
MKLGYHNIAYKVHSDNCYDCGHVDGCRGGRRCEEGKKLVRAAEQESKLLKTPANNADLS